MHEQLVEAWNIHDRINRYLLAAIAEEALGRALAAKHRTVFQLFAHLHNVRLMWLQAAAPELLGGLSKLEGSGGAAGDRAMLEGALTASGVAIASLVEQCASTGGRVKGFKPHVTAFVGYLIAHESHHRGQVAWTLKAIGQPLDKKTSYGMWEWGVR